MKTRILLILFFVAGAGYVNAQIEATQYFMNSLPQVVTNNPAFIPKYKYALGVPGSSIAVNYTNSGFSYNDLTRVENGKRVADLSKWAKGLPDKSYVTASVHADLFRLGLRINSKIYISLNSTVHGYDRTMIPKDMASLFVDGTAAYIGKSANFGPQVQATSYLENGVGVAIEPVENLVIGARVKMLTGFVNATTRYSDFSLSVADNYALTVAGNMSVKTSGLHDLDNQDGFKYSDYNKNKGFGLDLGATYKLMDNLTVAASLIDIGRINWKNNVYEYSLDKQTATYTFSGIDVQQVVNGNSGYMKAQADTLQEKFKPKETAGSSYATPLPAKVYLSGVYSIVPNFSVGTAFFAEKFQGRFAPGWALMMNKHFGKVLSTTLTYSVSNRSYNNLGAGLSLNLAPIQIYFVGDNLLRVPFSAAVHGNLNSFINNTQVFTFRMGVNFVWGWMKETDSKEDRSKSYNKGKRGGPNRVTTNKGKQPQPSVVRVRQKKR